MPALTPVSEYRASVGYHQNKSYEKNRKKSAHIADINPNSSTLSENRYRFPLPLTHIAGTTETLSRSTNQRSSCRKSTFFTAIQLLLLFNHIQPAASPLPAESDSQPFSPERAIIPAVAGNGEHTHLSNSGFNVIRNPIAEALYEAGEFISRYDPLTFPGAAAAPVNDSTYIGKEGDERVIIENIDGNIVELNRNYYQVAKRSEPEQFINNGKKALAKFYKNYNSKYPELISLASNHLREAIKKYFRLDIDPDKNHFITFKDILYDGNEKIQFNPLQKKTLTECLFTNFNADIQNNLVDTDAICGIYNSSLKESHKYYARDSVPIKPTDFIQLVWDIDFYNYAKKKVTESFSKKDEHIKKYFIDMANHLDIGNIDNSAAKDVLNGFGVLDNDNVRVTFFDIDGYSAASAFVIRNQNGRVTLYFPRSDFKFISFRGNFEMQQWVTSACATKEHRDMIASHFTIANRQDGKFYYGVDAWLRSIDQNNDYYRKIAVKQEPLSSEHFFEIMHNSIKDKTLSDLDSRIKSDAEIRRDMWEKMIDASNIIPNPISPFLSLAIHLDNAINADTYEEKMREWNNIKYDAANIVAMAVMDRAIASPDIEGYPFIEAVKAKINNINPENFFITSEKETGNSVKNNGNEIADDRLIYNKERDCYRVKRGAIFGKLCAGERVFPQEVAAGSLSNVDAARTATERVIKECKRIMQQWDLPESSSEGDLKKLSYLAENMSAGKPVLDAFIEAGSYNINEYLRYKTDVSSGKYAREAMKLKKIHYGLKDYEDFSYRVITVPSSRMRSFKIGDVVADKGFSCSSALFKNAKTWLRAQYINQFAAPGNDYVFIIYDKEVPKKIAGNHFLVDLIMLQPGEKIQINSIKNIYSSGKPIKILGVTKYDGDTPPVDIYSGE